MKIKLLILLSMIVTLSSCYRGDGSIGLSADSIDFDANGGTKQITYGCIMGIDYGSEIKDGVSTGNSAEIDDNENNDIFYLKDQWVSVEINRDTRTVETSVLPNDSRSSRQYEVAVWCSDTRGYLTIYQAGKE